MPSMFVGKDDELDEGEYRVTFTESFVSIIGTYRWPSNADELSVLPDNYYISKLTKLIPTGKSQRAFKVSHADTEFVSNQ